MIRQSKMVIYSRDFRWHAPYAGVFICNNPFVANIVHGAVVSPALMDAVNEIQSGSGEFSDKDWYRILGEMVNETKQDNLLKISQKILDNPINRAFNTIQKMIEYED